MTLKEHLNYFIGKDNYEYYPDFISEDNADKLYEYCKTNIGWIQHTIKFYDKTTLVPRLTKWYGDMPYKYSGITNPPCVMDKAVYKVMHKIINETGHTLNSCLLNYYRDGKDSIGMHKDDERELGEFPIIAVVSLGGSREFIIQRFSDKQKFKVLLPSGSLFVMKNRFNTDFAHGIDKVKSKDLDNTSGRISLTYRNTLA